LEIERNRMDVPTVVHLKELESEKTRTHHHRETNVKLDTMDDLVLKKRLRLSIGRRLRPIKYPRNRRQAKNLGMAV
jgi:hypothetical protein